MTRWHWAFVLISIATPAWGQTICQDLGDGITSCTNGTSSQRLGPFDFNSDGSWGQRVDRNFYMANPPANPDPDAPQYPPNPMPRNPDNQPRPRPRQ